MRELSDGSIIDDNLKFRTVNGQPMYVCRHCDAVVVAAGPSWREDFTSVFVGKPSSAGPHLNDNALQYLDVEVVLRQGYCPGCFTALFTETAPASSPTEATT